MSATARKALLAKESERQSKKIKGRVPDSGGNFLPLENRRKTKSMSFFILHIITVATQKNAVLTLVGPLERQKR